MYQKISKAAKNKSLSIGLLILISLFVLSFYKKIIALFTSPSELKNNQQQQIIDDIFVGNNATISIATAQNIADTIYQALDRFNDDEHLIYSQFDLIKSPDDMKLVYKQFGLRQYLLGTGANYLGQKMSLVEWLNNDLTTSELSKIQNKLLWI